MTDNKINDRKKDIEKLDNAIIFATKKHSGAVRKGTDIPYIVHPVEAMNIASKLTSDIDVLCGAVLHDTVEDTDTTKEELKEKFGEKVAMLVGFDSENKRENLPAETTWKIRKQETIDALDKADRDQQIIVISDKLSNLRSMYNDYVNIGEKLWERFNVKDKNQHYWYYKSIIDKLSLLKGTAPYMEYIRILPLIFNK